LSIIYRITNKENNKCYIGLTKFSLERRWKEHIKDSRKLDSHFHRAVFHYGCDCWNLEIIEEVEDVVLLVEREKYWINYYNTFNSAKGYNSTSGGEFFEHSEDTKKLLSSIRQGGNNPFFGKKHSEEFKQLMAVRNKGKNNPNYGKCCSTETKRKIKEANMLYCWVNNEIINKKILKEDIDRYALDGFKGGRIMPWASKAGLTRH